MQSKDLNFLLAGLTSIWVYLVTMAGTQTAPDSTALPSIELNVTHSESSTSSIKVTWEVADDNGIYHFIVQSQKIDRSDVIHSPPLPKHKRDYIIQDLRTNSKYDVCVYAHFSNDTDEQVEPTCVEMGTLALIRKDSLIVVVCAIGYILLMILLGYLVWRYYKSKQCKEEEEEGSEPENLKEQEEVNPSEEPRVYLPPPLNKVPRSSIEEENIPFITPPVDQLSDEEKEYYEQSVQG